MCEREQGSERERKKGREGGRTGKRAEAVVRAKRIRRMCTFGDGS